MSPDQLTAALIIFDLSVTSVVFWKSWLNQRAKEKELDRKVELSRLELHRRYTSTKVVSVDVDNQD